MSTRSVVGDETERELFTPSPFTALTRLGSIEDYGIARTVSYDQETGEYVCLVLSVYGSGGPHSDLGDRCYGRFYHRAAFFVG